MCFPRPLRLFVPANHNGMAVNYGRAGKALARIRTFGIYHILHQITPHLPWQVPWPSRTPIDSEELAAARCFKTVLHLRTPLTTQNTLRGPPRRSIVVRVTYSNCPFAQPSPWGSEGRLGTWRSTAADHGYTVVCIFLNTRVHHPCRTQTSYLHPKI